MGSLLIIGGTGTLGRQIVLQALTKPETIPPCLKGITAIIDSSTSRPDELDSLKNVDWEGKLYLIEAAKAANIKRFIFFSAQNVEQFPKIPLMKLKYSIEQKLVESKIPFTIFRLTGFYQNLIGQYAIPVLENFPIWVTNENMSVSYMDTQ